MTIVTEHFKCNSGNKKTFFESLMARNVERECQTCTESSNIKKDYQ